MRRVVLVTGPVAILGPLALLGVLLIPGATPFGGKAAARAGMADDPAALRLLDRAADAPSEVAYRGVQFVSAWTAAGSTGMVVDVDHDPAGGTTVRTHPTAVTRAETTHLPANSAEPSLLGGPTGLGLLGAHYSLALGAPARVAGRSADVVVVTRSDARRPAARFWLDAVTGLVLRREIYDERGRTTRASAFIDIAVGTAPGRWDDVTGAGDSADSDETGPTAAADGPHAWPNPIDSASLTRMRHRGWDCPDVLPPSLQLVDARRGGGDYDGIVHLSYSDGLSSVSVFEQRGRLSDHVTGFRPTIVRGRPVYVREGVPQRVVWSAHGTVYSVVADASARTVADVVVALPHAGDGRGGWHRLGRGLDRVASWFNPFG